MKNNEPNSEKISIIPKAPRDIPMPDVKPPKQVKSDSIVILRLQSSLVDEQIKVTEDKYTKKFNCKVVILEGSLQFVDVIDG